LINFEVPLTLNTLSTVSFSSVTGKLNQRERE